jgi:CRP-like cAMP-binding protein
MEKHTLQDTTLFRGISPEDSDTLLSCLDVRTKNYRKDEVILRAGEPVRELGLILSGSVNVVANFYRGSESIFGHFGRGEIFAENYAAVPGRGVIGDVVAAEDSEIMFIDVNRLLVTCENGCAFHQRLIRNLLTISAQKNLSLSTRMMHIAPKSIRERLLSYLSEQAMEKGSRRFRIPFDRRQLASYLGVDRSAMSNELSKMRRDGLITYHKSDFTLNVGAERE